MRLSKAPLEVLKRHEKRQDIVEMSWPRGLKPIRDEGLRGDLKGLRSSRLNLQHNKKSRPIKKGRISATLLYF